MNPAPDSPDLPTNPPMSGDPPPVDGEGTRYTAVSPSPAADPEATSYKPPDPESTRYGPSPTAGGGRTFQPRRVGNYELLEELARGGMGVVYRAQQLSPLRPVALKMMLAGQFATPEAVERFHVEATATAKLDHPNIVPIIELGELEGKPFLSMPFINGGSLQQLLAGGPVEPKSAARLVQQVAEAVQYAHDRGIIHRDLKPANILLQRDEVGLATATGNSTTLKQDSATGSLPSSAPAWKPPVPRLTDFGLAKLAQEGTALTASGEAMGTPSYMPPEQATGRLKEIGLHSDVYSLGAVLYCLLTGRPPFQSASAVETMRQVREEEPIPPQQLNPGVPRDLETICLKCLEKAPGRRYTSAQALADDLRRWLDGEPIAARPLSRTERVVRWGRKNPTLAALLLVTVLGITGIVWKYVDAEQQKAIALREADKAKKARDFLVGIFRRAETDTQGGNITVREILAEAEKEIPDQFADQPELRAELVGVIGEVNRGIGRRTPQAMILEVRGNLQLQSAARVTKAAVPQALVNLDDRLILSADAQVQLVFLSDFHKERLKPGREVTVDRNGCEPADAVLERDNNILMNFVRLPKGTFYMGWDDTAKPPKKGVKTEIKEDFEIAAHDVTQGQWQAVMGDNPSWFSRKGGGTGNVKDVSDEELKLFPVENVSWHDAQEFIEKLNEKKRGGGYLYRLPTEAEGEYACRGGATSEEECSFHFYFATPTNDLSSAQANFNNSYLFRALFGKAPKGNYLERPTRVGEYPSNKLGLRDMHGNVWQWTAALKDSDGVIRGGSWFNFEDDCRAAYRRGVTPALRSHNLGFRLARVPVR